MQIVTNQFLKEMKPHGSYEFPFLLSREKLSRYESDSFLWHWHKEIELTLITKGEMLYHFSNCSFHVHRGSALFGNANALHTAERVRTEETPDHAGSAEASGFEASAADCEYVSVTFDPRLIYGYENSLIHQRYVAPILQNPTLTGLHFDGSRSWHEEAVSLIRELIDLHTLGGPLSELDLTAVLMKLWKLIYTHQEPAGLSPAGRLDQERIQKLLEYIYTHYSSKFYLEDAAAHIGLCKSECCRLFKRCMKVTMFDFLLDYRIEKSLGYLAAPDCSVTEAAEKSGFEDSNYYSKVFRRKKGCSPTAYRRRHLHLP